MPLDIQLCPSIPKRSACLQEVFGPNAAIRTEQGWHGRVHVKMASNAFYGMSEED